jgi:hypothetical protein
MEILSAEISDLFGAVPIPIKFDESLYTEDLAILMTSAHF